MWRGRVLVVLVLGAGCLRENPAYDGPPAATSSGSESGSASSGGTTEVTGGAATNSSGGSDSGEASTGGGTIGETTGAVGASTGEASTGEASTGGAGPFCDPALQLEKGCAPLGQTGLLLCETITTWQDAKMLCEQMCGRLAIVPEGERLPVFAEIEQRMTEQDQLDQTAIEGGMGSAVTTPRSSVWIGARAMVTDGPYAWVDGSPMPAAKDMFGWGVNDPDYSGLCAVLGIFGKGADDGDYFDRKCMEEPYRFVCDPG